MHFEQPLRFRPVYQTRVWGGRRLQTVLGRRLSDPTSPIGESWEISDRPEAPSLVAEGPHQGTKLHDFWTGHRPEVFGRALLHHPGERYPLLMKILDACDDLSIQVHPPAEVAGELKGEPKTEMWFIAHADPGAKIYAGLRPGVTRAQFEQALKGGTVAEMVHVIEARTGDCLFIPSGRIHAIGKGLLIYEIQQNSDTTYRVFDWNRVGLDGQPRELHIDQSMRSIDFDDFAPQVQAMEPDGTLVACPFFNVRLRSADDAFAKEAGTPGGNLTLAVTRGTLALGGREWKAGDFLVVPAQMSAAGRKITTGDDTAQWLEIRIPT